MRQAYLIDAGVLKVGHVPDFAVGKVDLVHAKDLGEFVFGQGFSGVNTGT